MQSKIEFRLFAPRLEHVFLTGSFNSWENIGMFKENITGEFSVEIDLDDGEYLYKFRIPSRDEPNKLIDIIDPYAIRVEDEEHGTIVKVIKGKKLNGNEHQWKYDGKSLPENKDLIIYEIFIADFTEEGTFRSAMTKLDYLVDELGINCVQLMPVQAFLLGHDWGYTTKHFFAVEPTYGTSEDLKYFIDECHRRGIRVMIDAVFNHSHTECPLNKLDPTYWYYEGPHHPKHPEEAWGPEFNYDFEDEERRNIRPALKFISDVIRFWIEEYHIDGIRFDAAKQIDNFEVLRHFDSIGHSCRSPFYAVAEYVPATSDIVKPRGPVDGVWRNIIPPFQDVFQFPDNKSLFDKLLETGNPAKEDQYMYSTSIVNFYACHDNERTLYLLNQIRLFDEEAFKRLKIAAVWLMTTVGIPQIWMGEEWGEDKILGNEGRTTKINKIDWSARMKTSQQSLLHLYCQLIAFRKSSSAVKSDNVHFFHHDSNQHITAYHRWSNETDDSVVVLFNFSTRDQHDYSINNWPKNGRWKEIITGQMECQIDDNKLQVNLPSYEYKIFVFKG